MKDIQTELANIESIKRFLLDLRLEADKVNAELIGIESGQLERINEALDFNANIIDMIENLETKLN